MVNYQIAGHTMGTPEYTVLDALRLFHNIGLDGAEIVVQDGYRSGIPVDCPEETLQEIKDLAEKLNLKIIALTPYFSKFNDLDETTRQSEIAGLRKIIGYAKILGVKYIRVYAGNYAAEETDADGRKRDALIHSLKELGEDAREADVKLVMENHFNTMTVSAAQSIDIADKVDHPNVGILYDQANLAFTLQEDYRIAIPLQTRKVYYAHVKDLKFKNGNIGFVSDCVSHPKEEDRNVVTKIVGEGSLDWTAILQMLHDNGYDGWLSLEYERRWHLNDIPDASIGMKQSAEYLRNVCFPALQR